jgi:hypothetical protein
LNLHDATFALCSSAPPNAPNYNHRPQKQIKQKKKPRKKLQGIKHTAEKRK